MRAFIGTLLSTLATICTIVAASLLATRTANAATLNLLCKTELARENGSKTDFLRLYEISFDTARVSVYDNTNNGEFQRQLTTSYVRADGQVIVIAQRSAVYHEINRITGM